MHYFLGTSFKQKPTGIEKAQLYRLKIFQKLDLEAKCVYIKHDAWFYKHAEGFGVEQNCFTIYDYFQEAMDIERDQPLDFIAKWEKDGIYQLKKGPNSRGVRVFDAQDKFVMYAQFHDTEHKHIAYINHTDKNEHLIRREFYDSRGFLNKIKYLSYVDSRQPFLEQYLSPSGEVKLEKYFKLKSNGNSEVQWIILKNYQGKDYFFENEGQLITFFINKIYREGDIFYSDRHLELDQALGETNEEIPVVAILHNTHTVGMQTDEEVMTQPFTTPYRYVLENSDKYQAIIVSTKQQKEDIVKRIGNATSVEAIPVGYVDEEFVVDREKKTERFKIISVARYSPEKQLDHQLRLIEKLKEDYPEVELHIFGFGDRQRLTDLVKEMKLEKNVFIRGFQQELKAEYESSALSLSTSSFEGFSLAIFESLTHGVPVVSYDIRYGPGELIDDGKNGYLVEPNNEEHLYQKVKYFFDHPEVQETFRQAREEFISEHSEEKIKEKWLSVAEGNNQMKVGMLRNSKVPGILARAIAYTCSNHKIDFFYFTPEDVDLENKKIEGLFLNKGKWVKKITSFPDVIDNEPMNHKCEQLYRELEKSSFLVTKRIGSKHEVFNKLINDGRFDDVLIPYIEVTKLSDLNKAMDEFGTILLKPSLSNQGRDIYTLKRNGKKYVLGTDDNSEEYNIKEFKAFFDQVFMKRLFICQPFIDSKTKEGFPFDVRVHTRKNESGEWEAVKIYPRLGIGKAITSNISQGGGISPINSFLASQFDEKWRDVKKNLDLQNFEFPRKFQSLYDYSIDALGIDFGIDKSGKLWLFEVNTFPGARFFYAEDAEARVKYYKFCKKLQVSQ